VRGRVGRHESGGRGERHQGPTSRPAPDRLEPALNGTLTGPAWTMSEESR
jgi:hypothetical protein